LPRKILLLTFFLSFMLTGCFTAVEQGDNAGQNLNQENVQLKQTITNQNRKIVVLQKEIADLRAERDVEDEEDRDSEIVVQRLKVISEQVYTSGKNAGAVYGKFDLSAKVKNNSDTVRRNVKIVALFQRTQPGYPKNKPNIQTVMYTIPILKAGQTAIITFRGFRADHPGLIQEVLVHPVGYADITKTRVRAAFAPNTQE